DWMPAASSSEIRAVAGIGGTMLGPEVERASAAMRQESSGCFATERRTCATCRGDSTGPVVTYAAMCPCIPSTAAAIGVSRSTAALRFAFHHATIDWAPQIQLTPLERSMTASAV